MAQPTRFYRLAFELRRGMVALVQMKECSRRYLWNCWYVHHLCEYWYGNYLYSLVKIQEYCASNFAKPRIHTSFPPRVGVYSTTL